MVSSGDVARVVDQETARTGKMADPDALDRALLPLLDPGPVILDGYPRTTRQMAVLPPGFDVVGLRIEEALALKRIRGRNKGGWDEEARMREQRIGLGEVLRYTTLTVDVAGKTPGEIAFEILSSPYLSPPFKR